MPTGQDLSWLEHEYIQKMREDIKQAEEQKKNERTYELPKPRKVRVSRRLHLLVKCLFGRHNINDGTTCEISRLFWDVHDYKITKGGDGEPKHFYDYTCPSCGKVFGI